MIKISINKWYKTISFFAFVFVFNLTQKAQVCDWDALGANDLGQPSLYQTQYTNIAIDGNGTPYIVYKDLMYAGAATVKKYNGSLWLNVGLPGFSAGTADYTKIAFDATGTPYVAYQDNGNYATVMKFNGTSWVNVGNPSFTPGSGWQPSIAFDPNNIPYVFFGDGSNFNVGRVMKFNGSSWVTVGNPAITSGAPGSGKILFDGMGTPYVSYVDAISGLANVAKLVGSTWVSLGNGGISGTQVSISDMAIDNNGTPYVVYNEWFNSNQATVLKYNGTNWVYVGAQLISPGAASYPSITIDGAGTPYIAFKDGSNFSKAGVMKFNGSSWVTVGNPGALTGIADNGHIITDANGALYFIYSDVTNDLKAQVLKYNGASWENISNHGFSLGKSEYNNMVLDANGTPYVVYSDVINAGKASVKKYNNGNWTTVGVEGFSPILIDYTSIAVDGTGTPYVVFSDYFAKVMKYNGTSWVYVGTPNISAGNADYTDIAIDASGTPYIVFVDYANGQRATVMKYNGTAWLTVGLPGFSPSNAYYTQIIIDASGTPYVVFSDANSSYSTTVMKYNGVSWVMVGAPGFSPGTSTYLSIELDSFGNPIVAYSINTFGVGVSKFNGTSWSAVGPSTISTYLADYVSISLDANDMPYVCYRDISPSGLSKATVKQFNGTSWIDYGSADFSAYESKYNSIAIDANNKVYVSYASTGAFAKRFQLVTTATVSSSQVCEGANITFNATGGSAYNWTGPNSFTSNLQSPSISNINVLQGGTYTVTISDPSCVSTIKLINVTVNANPTITVSNGTLCLGNSYTMVPTGASIYTIQGGSAVVSPTANTSYTITGATLAGCVSPTFATVNLTVNALPLPTITVNSGSICPSGSFTMIPSGASSYTFQGGNAVVSPNTNTSYTVVGTASNGCISQSFATASITIGGAPSLTAIGGAICPGNSFTINPTGVIAYTIQGGNNVVSPVASTAYTVIGADANGCLSQVVSVPVNVNSSPTITVNSGAICLGQSFTINPTGANSYSIQGGNAVVNPLVNTTYTVIGTDVNGCVSQTAATSTVSITPNPTISASNGTVCLGYSFLISPTGASTYTFQGGNAVVTPTANTSYTVVGSTSNGCLSQASATVYLTVNANPTVTVNSGSICSGESFTIIPAGANTYTIVGASNIISPATSTMYTVFGVDINGCNNTATTSITVFTTCVWPGDANSDGTADNLDILELGLHYNQTGAARALISNLWQSYTAGDWVGLITNGKNLKHSDCNGDGVINLDDTLAVYNNYNLTHAFKLNETAASQLNIVPNQAILVNGQWGTASVYLGDSANAINNINGIAFALNYDHTLLEQDSVWLEYHTSFLDPTNTNLKFRKNNFSNDVLYTATTHTNNINVSGNGIIATLHYKISSALTATNVLNLSLIQANQSNANGLIVPVSSGTSGVVITNDVGIRENLRENHLSVFPNPTKNILQIRFNNGSKNNSEDLEIINVLGQVVMKKKITHTSTTFDLSELSTGVYYLKSGSGQAIKFIKE